MKKILIINGHPDKKSFCCAQAQALEKAAQKQKYNVSLVHAYDYPFIDNNPSQNGFPSRFENLSNEVSSLEKIVICSPLWNFGLTAGLKNFLDGAFQPQKSFRFQSSQFLGFLSQFSFLRRVVPSGIPRGMLGTSQVITLLSADSPAWYFRLFSFQNIAFRQIKSFFRFCGVRRFKLLFFGSVRKTSLAERKLYLSRLESFRF